MRWNSDADRYGAVAMAIHWATALVVLLLLATGLRMEDADVASKLMLLRVHAGAGATVLVLTLARIAWWAFLDRLPPAPAGEPPARKRAARWVHGLLYVAILLLAASGIGTLVLSGAVPILSGGGTLPRFDDLPPRAVHGLVAWSLIGLVAIHAGAALFHLAVLRDGVASRMGLGRGSPATPG